MKKTGEGRDEGDLYEVSDSDREAGGGRLGKGRGTGVELTDEGSVLKWDETAFAQRPPGRMMRACHFFSSIFSILDSRIMPLCQSHPARQAKPAL